MLAALVCVVGACAKSDDGGEAGETSAAEDSAPTGSASEDEGGELDACSLLTVAEVREVVGVSEEFEIETAASEASPFPACGWTWNPMSPSGEVFVTVYPGESSDDAQAKLEGMGDSEYIDAEELTDQVGDYAIEAGDGAIWHTGMTQLSVRSGSHLVHVKVDGEFDSEAANAEAAVKLAEVILPQL